jgi:hypothetical protein
MELFFYCQVLEILNTHTQPNTGESDGNLTQGW